MAALKDNPAYLRAVADSVSEFRSALTAFLVLHEINTGFARGIAPAVFKRNDVADETVAEAQAKVDRAAGKASAAAGLTNVFIAVQGVGTVDPIAAWSSMTRPKPVLEAEDVLGACDMMLGRLDAMAMTAEFAPPVESEGSAVTSPTPASTTPAKPSVFIGSSSEGLPVAEALQVLLDREFEVEIWNQGAFELSGVTLDSLVKAAKRVKFAILVTTADDDTTSRGTTHPSVRDNVIFELGLFMGTLGRERTFMVYDRSKRPNLPSDLAGVTPATYEPHSSGNLDAALGAAATLMKRQMRELTGLAPVTVGEDPRLVREEDSLPVSPQPTTGYIADVKAMLRTVVGKAQGRFLDPEHFVPTANVSNTPTHQPVYFDGLIERANGQRRALIEIVENTSDIDPSWIDVLHQRFIRGVKQYDAEMLMLVTKEPLPRAAGVRIAEFTDKVWVLYSGQHDVPALVAAADRLIGKLAFEDGADR